MKNPPLIVKAWFALVKGLMSLRVVGSEWGSKEPMLYSFQGALPSQPVPQVKDTLERFVVTRFIRMLVKNSKCRES